MYAVSEYAGYGTYYVWDSTDNSDTALLKDELLFLATLVRIKGVNTATGEINTEAKKQVLASQSAKAKLTTGTGVSFNVDKDNRNKVRVQVPGTELKVLRIPEYTTIVDKNTYRGNYSKLEEVIFPKSVEVLESRVFAYNRNLKQVSGLNNFKVIKSGAFMYTAIESAKLTGKKKLGSSIFAQCRNLRSIELGVRIVPPSLCSSCVSLSKVIISDAKAIESNAFRDCREIQYIEVNDEVERIEKGAFMNCFKESTVFTEPANNEVLGESCFRGANGKIILNKIPKALPKQCFQWSLATIVGLENVTELGDWCFAFSRGNTKFIFSDKLKKVGECAFSNANICKIDLGNGGVEIGIRAFEHAYITHLDLPSNVKLVRDAMRGSFISTVSYEGNDPDVLRELKNCNIRIIDKQCSVTFGEFEKVCRKNSSIGVESKGYIQSVLEDTCALEIEDNRSVISIRTLVEDIMFNGMGTVDNPEKLKNWSGFKK